jgi:hypothetical protein
MDRGDYYQAKCAVMAELLARVQADRIIARAKAETAATLGKLGVPLADSYACDDEALTITPQGGGPTDGR